MSGNFKYEDYDEDFSQNNSHPAPPKEPENVRVLGKEPPKQTETQVTQHNIPSDTSAKGKLVEQHLKLKSQLKELAGKMDEILEKERDRKKKKLQGQSEEDDERVVEMKKKLKEQELKMQKIKADIGKLRRNMDSKYDMNKIVDKENELKHLKRQLQVLDEEKQALEKIRKTQDKAIRNQDDVQSKNKKSRMEEELKQTTVQTKKQLQLINQKQKLIRKLHETYITKAEKAKEMQTKINQKSRGSYQDEITPEVIATLQEQLKQIQAEKVTIEKQGNQKIRVLDKQRKQLKNQLQRKKLILDQKQKQLRLNQMKHKQIIRLINSNQQQAVNESRVQKQNKSESKRVVPKKGREAPKIQSQQVEQPQQLAKQEISQVPEVVKPEKHEYGFSANLEDEAIIDDT